MCDIEDCPNEACGMVYNRNTKEVLNACQSHIDEICDYGSPEYVENCPNCGCNFGVN